MSFKSRGSNQWQGLYFHYIDKLANWRWLWTAITRATQLEHVYVYRYNNDKADKFNNNLLRSRAR